jgi:hypothetical protein
MYIFVTLKVGYAVNYCSDIVHYNERKNEYILHFDWFYGQRTSLNISFCLVTLIQ